MIKAFLIIIFTITISYAGTEYYGTNSTEAILKFEGRIETSLKADIDDKILNQIQHLIGHFHSKSFVKNFGYHGVLGDQYDYQILEIIKAGQKQIVRYQFEGKVNFDDRAFGKMKHIDVPILLPLNVDKVYALGMVKNKNLCTDQTYNSEGDFFYFWDIGIPGCPLKADKVNIVRTSGTLQKLANTKLTYPEYDRLYKTKTLKVSLFLGYIDDTPGKKTDDGYIFYHDLQDELIGQGFKVKSEERAFNSDGEAGHSYQVILEKSRKTALGTTQNIEISILLADTDLSSEDSTFHTLYADAISASHIVVYDGHSGLGANLGVDYLPNFDFGKQYQILFLNGCSSYPYFNTQYFEQKPGSSRNLEIITSGLPTLTSTSFSNMMAFLNPFIAGKVISYQRLMGLIEESNGEEDTYLMGVNGDEDNQFTP
jgi:hypothetical protein